MVLLNKYAGQITEKSPIYETEPWGFKSKNHFYNQVIILETKYDAYELLDIIHKIEDELGRVRVKNKKWIDRIIDIDILLFDNYVIEDEKLTIPHKHLAERRFVLEPLAYLAGNLKHPVLGKKIKELLTLL
jgi:2-amino-4-hydroxy-6-hydroxymethyldihydropteridine diphosphokinase